MVPRFVMGSWNVVTDSLGVRNQVIESEWTLVQEVVNDLLQRWPATGLFCDVSQLPSSGVFFSLNDSMVADTDSFLRSWDNLLAHAFTLFALIREVCIKLMPSLTLLCHLWLLVDHNRNGFWIFEAWH